MKKTLISLLIIIKITLFAKAQNKDFEIINMININSEKNEFMPMFFKDRVCFLRAKSKNKTDTFSLLNHIDANAKQIKTETFSFISSNPLSRPKPCTIYKKNTNSTFFSENSNLFYFASRDGNEYKGNTGSFKIYKASTKNRNKTPLPFNSMKYSCIHPFLSSDQTMLFFSSNMPGGFGGFDLYISYLEKNKWSPPVNLGPSVNTENDEFFPSVHGTEKKTLYFTCNKNEGWGGFDIYYAEEAFGSWSEPENMGPSVNSPANDIGLVFSGQKNKGYFASDRLGGAGGYDIYMFLEK